MDDTYNLHVNLFVYCWEFTVKLSVNSLLCIKQFASQSVLADLKLIILVNERAGLKTLLVVLQKTGKCIYVQTC